MSTFHNFNEASLRCHHSVDTATFLGLSTRNEADLDANDYNNNSSHQPAIHPHNNATNIIRNINFYFSRDYNNSNRGLMYLTSN